LDKIVCADQTRRIVEGKIQKQEAGMQSRCVREVRVWGGGGWALEGVHGFEVGLVHLRLKPRREKEFENPSENADIV